MSDAPQNKKVPDFSEFLREHMSLNQPSCPPRQPFFCAFAYHYTTVFCKSGYFVRSYTSYASYTSCTIVLSIRLKTTRQSNPLTQGGSTWLVKRHMFPRKIRKNGFIILRFFQLLQTGKSKRKRELVIKADLAINLFTYFYDLYSLMIIFVVI